MSNNGQGNGLQETGSQNESTGDGPEVVTAGHETDATQRVPEVLQYLMGDVMEIPPTLQLFLVEQGFNTPYKLIRQLTPETMDSLRAQHPYIAGPAHWRDVTDLRQMLLEYQVHPPPGSDKRTNSLVLTLVQWKLVFTHDYVDNYYLQRTKKELADMREYQLKLQHAREKLLIERFEQESVILEQQQAEELAKLKEQWDVSSQGQPFRQQSPQVSSTDSSDQEDQRPFHGSPSSKGTFPDSAMSSGSSPGKRIKHVSFAKVPDVTSGSGGDGGGDDGSSSSSSSSLSSEGDTSTSSSAGDKKKKARKKQGSSGSSLADTLDSTLDRMSLDRSKVTTKPMVKLDLSNIKDFDGKASSWKPFYQSIIGGFTLARQGHLLTVNGKRAIKKHKKHHQSNPTYNVACQNFFAILLTKTTGGTAHAQVEKHMAILDRCLAGMI